jgi:two-component system sensor histidine kinase HupT/HoxJ
MAAMTEPSSTPPRRAPGLIGPHDPLLPEAGHGLGGVAEETWLDVIRKMDEVYSQLVTDEIALEEKNAELERSPGESTPVAVQHIVRSFDPCMVCTVH